jgi:hypothetical protein
MLDTQSRYPWRENSHPGMPGCGQLMRLLDTG